MAHTDKTKPLALRTSDGDTKRSHGERYGKPSTIKTLKAGSSRHHRREAKASIRTGREVSTGHGQFALAYWN